MPRHYMAQKSAQSPVKTRPSLEAQGVPPINPHAHRPPQCAIDGIAGGHHARMVGGDRVGIVLPRGDSPGWELPAPHSPGRHNGAG